MGNVGLSAGGEDSTVGPVAEAAFPVFFPVPFAAAALYLRKVNGNTLGRELMRSLSESLSRNGAAAYGGFAVTLGLAVAMLAASIGAGGAQPGRQSRDDQFSKFQCTNPKSGTTWDVKVDYDRSTVDSFPAKITNSQIAWHDATHGGYYYLDRASGALTFKNATTTGGYSLRHTCRAG
jgi:hypothetical protein